MVLLKSCRCMLVVLMVLAGLAGMAWGQDADADQAKALLAKGVQQYTDLQFVDAKATFLQADKFRASLSADDVKTLDGYLAKVDIGIKRQSAGALAFEKAEDALRANNLEEARTGFQEVAANEYVPPQLRKDAQTQLALVESRMKNAGQAIGAVNPVEPAVVEPAGPVEPPAVVEVPPVVPSGNADVMLSELAAQNVDKAKSLVAQGNAALAGGDAATAMNFFLQAQMLAPDMPEVRQGIEAASARLARAPAEGPLDRLERQQRIERERAVVKFEDALKQARETLRQAGSASDFARAADGADYAKTFLQSNKMYFPAEEYQRRMREAEDLTTFIAASRSDWERGQVEQKKREAEAMAAAIEVQTRRERESRIARLHETVRVLEAEHKYGQAIEMVEEILRLDPNDAVAKSNLYSFQQFMMVQQQREIHDQYLLEEMKVLVDVDRSRIPWYEIIVYAREWPEISQKREMFGLGYEADTEADRTARRRLQQVLPRIQFDGIELAAVVQFLRDVSNTSIHVNWAALQTAGIDRTTPVTVQLTDVTVEKALRVILDSVGGVVALGFVLDEGVLTISTREDLSTNVYTRVYDIRDLIVRVPNFTGQRMDLGSAGGNRGGTGSTGGTGGGGLFGGTGTGTGTTGTGNAGEEETLTRTEMVTQILDLVRNTIDRDSWIDNGGRVGSIAELSGQIVVTQTADNHTRLLDLLKQLREQRALQVNIEARFVQVSSGFLNDIGINLDFFFNIGSDLAMVNNTTTPNTLSPNTPSLPWWSTAGGQISNKVTPIPVVQGSSAFTLPSPTIVPQSIATGFGTSVAPAMTLGGSFLDDIQVDFFISATQADTRATTLTAPRLTLFNGQRAYVTIATETAYVSDLDPVVSDNAIGFDTTIDVVASGTTLDVEATVSADRKYVTLTMRPQVSVIDGFNTYAVTVTDTDDQGVPLTGSGFIQLPTVTIQSVETTVSVPDRGTLLIGGQKLAGEVTKEMGVPVLSKIPIINRAFTNRSTVRDERTLLILVKPTIIIHAETEQERFGV